MCPPLLAVAAIGATVASVGVSLYGASKASDAAAAKNEQDQRNYILTGENYDRQAVAADVNAGLADKSAELTAEQMDWDVSRVRDKSSRVQGSQRAAFAASGIESGAGTTQDVAFDSLNEAEKDIYAIRFSAKTKADAYQAEAAAQRVNADNLRINANNARQGAVDTAGAKGTATAAPYINAAASSLSAVSSLASNQNVTRFGSSLFAA